jgi:nitroreductase
MDLFEAIGKRTSVRAYSNKPISKKLLEKLIDAGKRAPTGRNVQPLEFIVLTQPDKKQLIANITNYGKFLSQAPACIAVYSKNTKYYLEDGCAAVENILLAATALGLGSCWIAGDKKPYVNEIQTILRVPSHFRLVALIAIGYSQNQTTPTPKRTLKKVIHWEQF